MLWKQSNKREVSNSWILGKVVVLVENFERFNSVVAKVNVVFFLSSSFITVPLYNSIIIRLFFFINFPLFAKIVCDFPSSICSFKKIFKNWPSSVFSSTKIVKPETVSINFFSFIKDGSISISEFLMNDLAASWVNGTTTILIKDWTIRNKIENWINLFAKRSLLMPTVQ